ncbi:MAG TPA: glycosyltransferase family A protein [Candidatus Limnocylindria bacterium]|nr:glycosyltransferase family A protein [Candidatus Limnocylindria bacterium]
MNLSKHPLVSVIVTTRNNQATLNACLRSITEQTYKLVELITIDNQSTDETKTIARTYTPHVFDRGPERSAQRNYAVAKAKGQYVLIIDSDMELEAKVVAQCVEAVQLNPDTQAAIIPEESFGQGFWAQCKRLERSFYVGVDSIEAARFFDKKLFEQAGGYNESQTGAEDWDLTNRIAALTSIARIPEYIFHNEGRIRLRTALKKRFYYNKGFLQYYRSSPTHQKPAASVLNYYKLYLSRPAKLFRNPIQGMGMLFMKTCEFGTGALSMLAAKREDAR